MYEEVTYKKTSIKDTWKFHDCGYTKKEIEELTTKN